LHTADAKGAITRLVDLFPNEAHDDVRTQLSMSLRFVIAQHLLPARDTQPENLSRLDSMGAAKGEPARAGTRRVLAMEVLYANFAVRAGIRAGKIESLDSQIQSGRRDGMWSFDAHLRQLVQEGRIDLATAKQFAKDPAEFGANGS